MKRMSLLMSLMCLAVFTTSYTQRAHAMPRYGWENHYFVYDSLYACGREVGQDIRRCNGSGSIGGDLNAPFKHAFMVECSSGTVLDNDWYVYCPSTWIPWSCPTDTVPC